MSMNQYKSRFLFVAIGLFSLVLLPFILRTKGPARKDPLQLLWQKFLKRLQSAGYETQASTGAIELAQAAALSLPGDAPAIYRIADLYSRYRYSPLPPPFSEVKNAVKDFHPKGSAV